MDEGTRWWTVGLVLSIAKLEVPSVGQIDSFSGPTGRASAADRGRGRSKPPSLLLVAAAAEQLDVLDGVPATHRKGNDVVVLQVEVATAFNAAPIVSLPDGMFDVPRNWGA